MNDVLEFKDVSLRRGSKTILSDVSWRVSDTDRWVILGANGAGKTTLLQIAAARMHPTTGEAWVLGKRLGAVDVFELRPRIGFASAALAGRIPGGETVFDTVITGAYAVTGRWRESYAQQDVERADALMAAFGVGQLAGRMFGTLSEGEKKRAQIARALMSDPELLLLDEPSAGLDLGGRETLVAALAELAADEKAPVLVLVTHRTEEIPPGFTHALVMKDGRVSKAGPIDEAITGQALTDAFETPLSVEKIRGRWVAQAA